MRLAFASMTVFISSLLAVLVLLATPSDARADSPDGGFPAATHLDDAASADGVGGADAGTAAQPEDAAPPPPFQPAIIAAPVVVATPVANGGPGGPSTPTASSPSGFAFGVRLSWGFPFGIGKDPTRLGQMLAVFNGAAA